MRSKSVALIAAAASAVAAGITSKSQAQTYTYYRPVVSLIGDGATADTTAFGATTTIQTFNYAPSSMSGIGAINQSTPIAAFAYANNNSTGPSGALVTTADSSTEGDLENDPGLADAATAGLPYSGTGYVFSGGYQGTDGEATINTTAMANRVVGYMSVTGNFVSPGTIGSSTTAVNIPGTTNFNATYTNGNIRSAVGDDTPSDGNFWTAGTGTSNSTSGFTASFRYTNVNTLTPANESNELTTSAANNRRIQIRGGQLWGGSNTGNFTGISLINYNANPSTTAGLATTLASPGVTPLFSSSLQPASSSVDSPMSFVLMNDPNNPSTPVLSVTQTVGVTMTTTSVPVPFNVAYIADDGTTAGFMGIQKWNYNPTLAGGTALGLNNGWVLDYVIPDPKFATGGNVGLAAQMVVNPSNPTLDEVQLYSTDFSAAGTQNYLIQTTDLIDASSPNPSAAPTPPAPTATLNSEVVLAESPTDDAFRGVALAPIVPITAAWNSTAGGNWSPSTSWSGVGNNSTSTNASLITSSIPGAYQ